MKHCFLCSFSFGIDTRENLTPVSETEETELRKKNARAINSLIVRRFSFHKSCDVLPTADWLLSPGLTMINTNLIVSDSLSQNETMAMAHLTSSLDTQNTIQ